MVRENPQPTLNQIDRWEQLFKHLLRKRKQAHEPASGKMEEGNKRIYKTCSFLKSVKATEKCITAVEQLKIRIKESFLWQDNLRATTRLI